jgi:hypothetical protein
MQQPAPVVAPPSGKVSLLEAIAAASHSFGELTKDSKNEYLKSSYLGLPGLLKAVKRPLLEQGVTVYTQVHRTHDGFFVVRTTLSLVSGEEEISSDFPVPEPTNLHKIGAAVTYGTRYNLLAMLAVCPEADDDGTYATYGSGNAAPASLPGLPGGVAYQQQPAAPMPPAMAHPVQPLPVLQ